MIGFSPRRHFIERENTAVVRFPDVLGRAFWKSVSSKISLFIGG